MSNGTFTEFITPELQKENYKFRRLRDFKPDTIKFFLNTIQKNLRTREELYQASLADKESFNTDVFLQFLEDPNKTDEILRHYTTFMQHCHKKGISPYTKPFMAGKLEIFTEFAIRKENKAIALACLSDMAKYSLPEPTYEIAPATKTTCKHKEYTGESTSFLELINGINQKHIKNMGIEKEVQSLVEEYNSRPEIDFYFNGSKLAKKRKILAFKMDYMLGTSLRKKKLPNVFKHMEDKISALIYKKNKKHR